MKITEKRGTCWVGYKQVGMKKKGDRMVPNCVKNESKLREMSGVEKVLYMADHGLGKLAGKTVDGMTANLFKAVYNKANDKTKEKINKMNDKQLYVFMTKLWSKFGRQVKI